MAAIRTQRQNQIDWDGPPTALRKVEILGTGACRFGKYEIVPAGLHDAIAAGGWEVLTEKQLADHPLRDVFFTAKGARKPVVLATAVRKARSYRLVTEHRDGLVTSEAAA